MRYLALLVAFLACAATPVAAAPNAKAILGTFSCRDTDGQGHVWRFASENVPFGTWVDAKTSFPAQNGGPARTAQTFIGYDASAKAWHIVSVGDGGTYYTRESASSMLDGSTWTDRDPRDGGRAVITLPDAHHYVFTFHQSARSSDVQRVVCTRSSST